MGETSREHGDSYDDDALTTASEVETESDGESAWLSEGGTSSPAASAIANRANDGVVPTLRRRALNRDPRLRKRQSHAEANGNADADASTTIFFGTPCKEEHERRAKYQAKMRTRRILRKDSIELARRKSAGNSSASSRSSLPHMERENNQTSQYADNAGRADSDNIGDHTFRSPSRHREEDVRDSSLDDDKAGLQSLFLVSSRMVDDPDATEDADWFGISSSEPVHPTSAASFLPSTPTRQEGSDQRSSTLYPAQQTPSEADSSPGMALMQRSVRHEPSPLSTAHTLLHQSPISHSPLTGQRNSFYSSIEAHDKENIGSMSASTSKAKKHILQDSAQKLNVAQSPWQMSPSKAQVRRKLAAWADAKLQTPKSPAKQDGDSLMRWHTRSPSQDEKPAHTDAPSTLQLAASLPLPASPEKPSEGEPIHAAEYVGVRAQREDRKQSLAAERSLEQKRASKLPVSASRLPRPFKAVHTGTTALEKAERSSVTSLSSPRAKEVRAWGAGPKKEQAGAPLAGANKGLNIVNAIQRPQKKTLEVPFNDLARATQSAQPKKVIIRSAKDLSSSTDSGRIPDVDTPSSAASETKRHLVRDARLISVRREPDSAADREPVAVHGADDIRCGVTTDSSPEKSSASPSIGVGGARRVPVATALQNRGKHSSHMHVENAPTTADQTQRKVALRSRAHLAALPRERSSARTKPMRKIGDYVGANRGVNELNSDTPSEAGVESVSRSHKVSKTESHSKHTIGTKRDVASGTRQKDVSSPILPLSSAELSKLTSLHTRINETSCADKDVVVVRMEGQTRPPSPSSKFRKAQKSSASLRAAARAAAADATPDHEEGSKIQAMSTHVRGAGEEEPYASPVRRITLKKTVRWHKALFAGPSDATLPFDDMPGAHKQSIHREHTAGPTVGCLKATVSVMTTKESTMEDSFADAAKHLPDLIDYRPMRLIASAT